MDKPLRPLHRSNSPTFVGDSEIDLNSDPKPNYITNGSDEWSMLSTSESSVFTAFYTLLPKFM